jgi:hypothetical protein
MAFVFEFTNEVEAWNWQSLGNTDLEMQAKGVPSQESFPQSLFSKGIGPS